MAALRSVTQKAPLYATTAFLAASFAAVASSEGWDPTRTAVFGLAGFVVLAFTVIVPRLIEVGDMPNARQTDMSATAFLTLSNELEAAHLRFVTALVATLDARDRYTAGHSAAVAIYARDIARRMGLGPLASHTAQLAGLVHDIGKIGLPSGLLDKPGALTLEERRAMEVHSVIGEKILKEVPEFAELAEIVRYHHERVDGQGYPDRLAGDQIPLIARIVAVADAYSAMTADRPYRDAMPSRIARLRLAQAVETSFDTSVVAAFEAILAGADEAYRTGRAPEMGEAARSSASSPEEVIEFLRQSASA
jgi:putative nucleotidyltransferase with HDIG domain